MSTEKEQKAVALLREKAQELGRLPKKDDFDPETTMLIKQALGPWTRALEKAELKPVSQRYLEKRLRIKEKKRRKKTSGSKQNRMAHSGHPQSQYDQMP